MAEERRIHWMPSIICYTLIFYTQTQFHTTSAVSITPDDNQVDNPSSDRPQPTYPANCSDRLGQLPVNRFHHRSCTLCYVFLFVNMNEFYATKTTGFEVLIPRNMTDFVMNPPVVPDPNNETSMKKVCSTLSADECDRWNSCCRAAIDCCTAQRQVQFPTSEAKVCPRTWDGFSCWDDTPAGTKVSTPCPSFYQISLGTRNGVKECTANATWLTKHELAWTDYTPCIDIEGTLRNVYICVGSNVASILLVLPSIIIFFIFRDLTKQHRIRLHINFFLSLLLRSVAVILWFLLVHYEKVTNPKASEAVMILNPIWCRVLSFFKIYLNSTTFAWMFCEGYYLHRLISRAFEPPKSLITLYILGWAIPAIPAIAYSIIRVIVNNEKCWINNLGELEWVLYAPNFICLILNIIFLCNILRILLYKLHSHPHEPSNFRRGLKAAFMLIPLFGIQLILTIYRPSSKSDIAGSFRAYEYISTIVINSQGVFVALIFCFFNGEVLAHFHDRCPCCRMCIKRFIRTRSPSNPMTQITYAEERRSPTDSIHSQNSNSPKRNGGVVINGYKDMDLQDLNHSHSCSNSSVHKEQNGGSPNKSGYTPIPTDSEDSCKI